MSLAAALMQEIEMETVTTRRVLERVPAEKFTWSPAAKSRTLGELSMHIATNPGSVMSMAAQNPADVPGFGDTMPVTTEEVLAALEASVAEARRLLSPMSDATLNEMWSIRANGVELMAMPRIAFMRMVLLNHWYHHRGQLTVYLRLLGVPLPSIYGPSADENPFA